MTGQINLTKFLTVLISAVKIFDFDFSYLFEDVKTSILKRMERLYWVFIYSYL